MLIDNAHSLLCLDDSAAMRAEVKGPHIALQTPAQTSSDGLLIQSLIISARLSDGLRPVRLKLDSGTNVPFLFNTSQYMALGSLRTGSLLGGGFNGVHRLKLSRIRDLEPRLPPNRYEHAAPGICCIWISNVWCASNDRRIG